MPTDDDDFRRDVDRVLGDRNRDGFLDRLFEVLEDHGVRPLECARHRQEWLTSNEVTAEAIARHVAADLGRQGEPIEDRYWIALHAARATIDALAYLLEDLRPAAVKPLTIWGEVMADLIGIRRRKREATESMRKT